MKTKKSTTTNPTDSDPNIRAMMKRTKIEKRVPLARKQPITETKSAEGNTIAMLPSTTLKYREGRFDPQETAMKHSPSQLMPPASPQDVLRPTVQSAKFFFGEEGGLNDAVLSPYSDCASPSVERTGTRLQRSASSSSLCEEPTGMRRTPPGMFMPYDENDVTPRDDILSQVINIINTARDIVHVIWNADRGNDQTGHALSSIPDVGSLRDEMINGQFQSTLMAEELWQYTKKKRVLHEGFRGLARDDRL